MRKIGLLSLALVLALGALGVGYAAWTDQVTIEGTVKTGTLSLDVVGYSGTHVYKTAESGVEVISWENEDGSHPETPEGAELIGWAGARPGDPAAQERDVVVTFHNIFPCVEFEANVELHCSGTVPIEVKAELMPLDEATKALMTEIIDGGGTVEVRAYLWNSITNPDGREPTMVDPTGFIQMHNCDILKLVLMIYLPQVDALQGRTGSFYVDINAIQFNKVGDYDDYFPYNGGLVT